MPRNNNRRKTEVFDPCDQAPCNHSFGNTWSSDRWEGNSRNTMRVIRSFFQTCSHCGWNKFIRSTQVK